MAQIKAFLPENQRGGAWFNEKKHTKVSRSLGVDRGGFRNMLAAPKESNNKYDFIFDDEGTGRSKKQVDTVEDSFRALNKSSIV